MGPALEKAGEGMVYDIEANDSFASAAERDKNAPKITWRTAVEGLSNVAGNKFGGMTGKFVGKYSKKGGQIAGTFMGIESSNIILKGFDYASGKGSFKDIFVPDLSPVEFLESMVAAHVLHKFSERWNKGKAPKVPKDVSQSGGGKAESKLTVEKIAANKRAAETQGKDATAPDKKGGTGDTAGKADAKPALADKFKQAPKGVAPTLDAVKSRWDPAHNVEMTPDGLQWCSPRPCPLLRKKYQRELKQKPELASLLDDIEVQRRADPKEKYWRDQSTRMEARLAELKATNDLVDAIPEKDLKQQARGIVESRIGLDGQQVDLFAKEMAKQGSREGRQRLIVKFKDLALKSADARGRGRLGGVDPRVDLDVEKAIDDQVAAAEKNRKGGPANDKGSADLTPSGTPPLNLQDVIARATKSLRNKGISGLPPKEYGTKLHAEVNNIIRSELGKVPKGWKVGSDVKISSLIKIKPATAKMTVREYLDANGLKDQIAKLPEKMLNTKVGEMMPDVFVQAPDGTVMVWDLTSRMDPVHMSKTMLYGDIIGRETGAMLRIQEDYWRKVTKDTE